MPVMNDNNDWEMAAWATSGNVRKDKSKDGNQNDIFSNYG